MNKAASQRVISPIIDHSIIAWLLGLSFWAGVSFWKIQQNRDDINNQEIKNQRMWDAIHKIKDDTAYIRGYLEKNGTAK